MDPIAPRQTSCALQRGSNGLEVRRELDGGRQVPFITTDMHDACNLDALPVHHLAEQDPEASIVNPRRRNLSKQIRRVRIPPIMPPTGSSNH